jgi:threonine/homoserine/homoserine lactone efflux protein
LAGVSQALPYSLGIALRPVPIGASVVFLSCRDGLAKGASFALGWIAGLAATALVLALIVGSADLSTSDQLWIAVPELMLGVGFLAVSAAIWLWHDRRRSMPAWLDAVEHLTRARSAAVGVVASAANPKVAALTLGAVLALAQMDAGRWETVWTLVIFTAIGALGVAVPVLFARAAPRRASAVLSRLHSWLERHDAAVLIVLGLVVGAIFVMDGLRGL